MNFVDQSYLPQLKTGSQLLLVLLAVLFVSLFLPSLEATRVVASYAPVHSILEIFSVVVSVMVFSICWGSKLTHRPDNLLLLGCLFLGVAILDLLHMLSYVGMPDFITPNTAEKSIDFWLFARSIAALGLLCAVLLPSQIFNRDSSRWLALAFTLLTIAGITVCLLFFDRFLPRTFVLDKGLTLFKIVSEYLLSALYLLTAVLLLYKMRKPLPYDAVGLFIASCLMAMSEIFFTLYTQVNDLHNLLGHAYKIIAYAYLYKSIFLDNINRPYQHLQQATEALQKSEQRLTLSQQFSNVGSFEWNLQSGKVILSDNLWHILGREINSIKLDFDTFISLIHPEDRENLKQQIRHSIRTGEEADIEYRLLWPDGSEHWLRGRGSVIYDQTGKAHKMLGVLINIDSIKLAENEKLNLLRQLQQAQKMESIGQLTGGIAHDFNNLLTTIIGYAQLAQARLTVQPDEKLDQYQHEILYAGQRGKELVGKMLAFGRSGPNTLQAVDGAQHLREIITLLNSTLPSTLTLTLTSDEKVPKLLVDPVQFHQVITNLVINAYHAVPQHGTIALVLHAPAYFDSVCDSCHRAFSGTYVEVNVQDNGKGIPAAQLLQVFEPFYTTKKVGEGSGMGLSVVDGILHQCNGHILVDSEPDVGSNFRMLFCPASNPLPDQQTQAITTP